MILVRQVFQTKWGKAHEVAEGMRQSAEIVNEVLGGSNLRILTDLSGDFHRVVQEYEVESMAVWEANAGKLFSHPDFQKAQAQSEGMIESGYREFYTVEYAS
jgi:hypothetical protein